MVEIYIEVVHNNKPDLFIFRQGHVGLAIAKTLEDGLFKLRELTLEMSGLKKVSNLKLSI